MSSHFTNLSSRIRLRLGLLGLLLLLLASCTRQAPLPPEERLASFERTEAAMVSGNLAMAETNVRDSLVGAPDDPLLALQLCRVMLAQERWAEASVECRIPLALDPTLSAAAFNTGCALSRLGLQDDALGFLALAWKTGLQDPDAYMRNEDLVALRGDQRLQALAQSGQVGPQGRAAFLHVSGEEVELGGILEMSLTVVDLDRSPLAAPARLEATWAARARRVAARPRARIERMDAGGSGGREAQRHSVVWRIQPTRSGPLLLGPMDARLDGEALTTIPQGVLVREGSEESEEALDTAWFVNPSVALMQPPEGTRLTPARGNGEEGIEVWSDGTSLIFDLSVNLPSGQLSPPPQLTCAGQKLDDDMLELTALVRRSSFGASRLRLEIQWQGSDESFPYTLEVNGRSWSGNVSATAR